VAERREPQGERRRLAPVTREPSDLEAWCWRKFGFSTVEMGVPGEDSYLVHTVGLGARSQFDLIVFGLPRMAADLVLFSVARRAVRDGVWLNLGVLEVEPEDKEWDSPAWRVVLTAFDEEDERRLVPGGRLWHALDEPGEGYSPNPMMRVRFIEDDDQRPFALPPAATILPALLDHDPECSCACHQAPRSGRSLP
jgi:hypothetical protein